jgi:hypothetical protein
VCDNPRRTALYHFLSLKEEDFFSDGHFTADSVMNLFHEKESITRAYYSFAALL